MATQTAEAPAAAAPPPASAAPVEPATEMNVAAPPSSSGGGIKVWLPLLITVITMPVLAYVTTMFLLVPRMQKALAADTAAEAAPEAGAKPSAAEAASAESKSKAPSADKTKEAATASAQKDKTVKVNATGKTTVPLSKILVNVAGTMGSRYLQVGVTVAGGRKDFADIIQGNEAQLIDLASGVLSSKTITDLERPEARTVIRSELLTVFNNSLAPARCRRFFSPTLRFSRSTDIASMSAPTQTTESSAPIPALTEEGGAAAVPAGLKSLRQGGLVPEGALRKLRVQQEEFARSLSARLSMYLRLDFSVDLAGLQTISFQKFIERADTPLHLTLCKLDPLRGIGVLEISPPLRLSIVDRQLGGSGKVEEADRALTEIETALLNQVVEMILAEWCASWRPMQELKPSLLGHEIDARFLNAIPRETLMLEVTFDANMNECRKGFRIGLPYATLEMLVRRLDSSRSETQVAAPAATGAAARWNPHFDGVPVTLAAVCDGLELTARALANLKPGDTLTLDPEQFNQVQIRVGGTARFVASPGTSEGRWAVQVTRRLEA